VLATGPALVVPQSAFLRVGALMLSACAAGLLLGHRLVPTGPRWAGLAVPAVLLPAGSLLVHPLGWGPAMVSVAIAGMILVGWVRSSAATTGNHEREAPGQPAARSGQAGGHDALTGLLGRSLLVDRLREAAGGGPGRAGRDTALLLVDIDDFTAVNETFGHDVGDQVLTAVAERIRELTPRHGHAARLGGDEFAILLQGIATHGAAACAHDILDALQAPVIVGQHTVPVSASIGMHVDGQADDPSAALRRAGLALRAAKRDGGNRLKGFEAKQERELAERRSLERDLRRAAGAGELRMHYQPIMSLAEGRIMGVEGLLRWRHPERGLLAPAEFMDVAEQSGAIVDIGRWVVQECCHQLARWSATPGFPEGFHVSINLSRRQFADRALESCVADALRRTGVPPRSVILEVTETALEEDPERLVRTLRDLRRFGVQIAMDDFGTGYSSLSELRRLPTDIIKIDRAFVGGIHERHEDLATVTAIVNLARGLGKRTIAEGVETGAQLAHLRALDVEMAQGFLFSEPVPAGIITAMLAVPAADKPAAPRPAARRTRVVGAGHSRRRVGS
jgi:diguanylate cyclase (GGDEF)-like protein